MVNNCTLIVNKQKIFITYIFPITLVILKCDPELIVLFNSIFKLLITVELLNTVDLLSAII